MPAASTDRLDCLVVVGEGELFDRTREVLVAWRLSHARVNEAEVLPMVEQGACRVVITDRRPGLRLFLERLKASGAQLVLLGARGPDVIPEVDCVTRPSELVAAVFRAQGRLTGISSGIESRISEFAQVIAEQFTLPALTSMAMNKTRELCEADGASLLLIEPSSGGLYIDTVAGDASDRLERIHLPRGRGVAGRVAVEARPRLVEDAQNCPDFDRTADKQSGFQTGSIVAAPLVLGGDVLGVLMAVRSTSVRPFSPVHLERLVHLTPHVAIAVHNAQITTALRTSQKQVIEANVDLEKKVRERTEMISRAKQEWERTFDAIDAPIALIDGYEIRRTNQAYARAVGLGVKELPGRKCHQVFARRDTPCPQCPIAEGRGRALDAELATTDPTGRNAFFRFHGYWMSDDPGSRLLVATYHDITQSTLLTERLRESERLAAVGQLASGAAHEINNPLGFVTSNLRSLRGLIDELRTPLETLSDALEHARGQREGDALASLARGAPPDLRQLEDGLEMIDESLDGARRVGDIVKGLRELSRLEIGKREPANVNASVTRVARAELGEAPQNVVMQLEATLLADIPPLQLDQVLGHVLRNARQATPRRERIVVRTAQTDEWVTVVVRDEGVGIPREHHRRVFEPFFTTRGVGKGIGLGLTAAYGIVKRVGGDIEAQSEGPGRGATFTIRLPIAANQPASSPPSPVDRAA
ncbi:MAG: ATP-binding protein [Myxococcaceae bacterium]